jgi:cell division protein FtsN
MKSLQRGGFVLGVVVGLLVGLSIALGVALYITKAPVPFVNKVPQRTAEQDQAEVARNRNWDPNAPLAGKTPKIASAPEAGPMPGVLPPPPDSLPGRPADKDPAAILAGTGGAPTVLATTRPTLPPTTAPGTGVEPFVFFVQAGAYTRAQEAEQQRAKLAMLGQTAKITEREQSGRVVYRVRVGPFETRGQADRLNGKLQESGIESQLIRVERP